MKSRRPSAFMQVIIGLVLGIVVGIFFGCHLGCDRRLQDACGRLTGHFDHGEVFLHECSKLLG